MQCVIVLSALVAACAAAPGFYPGYAGFRALPYAAVAPVAVESQFHAQDVLGQYTYGYSGGPSAKTESRSADGSVSGGYSYVDAAGEVQNVQYTADAVHGFRVAASNLPAAPAAPAASELVAPLPVQETVEVAQARAEHLAAFEEVKSRKVEEIVKPVAAPVPIAYSAPIATPYAYPAYNNFASKGFAYSAPAYYPYNYKTYAYPETKAFAYSAPIAYETKTYAYPEVKTYAYPEVKTFAYAAPAYESKAFAYAAPVAAYAAPIVAPAVTSQFHAQDELGQYSYGYSGGLSAKTETKSFDGVTRGGYSYVDAAGEVQNVQYTADAVNGFRVAASNLPVAPVAPVAEILETVPETAEVAAAKSAHFAAHVEAKERFAKALL